MYKFFTGITLTLLTTVSNAEKLNLQLEHIGVSGLSSGGYMANQFHVAHSDWVNKAGIIAAGPYYCAQGNIKTALEQCVNQVLSPLSIVDLNNVAQGYEQEGKISPLTQLKNSKVWLFHGLKDAKVLSAVSDALYQQYQAWVDNDNIIYVNDKNFAHLFPTLDSGTTCTDSISPFIGNCDYDAAGAMLGFLYGKLSPRAKEPSGRLIELNQQVLGGLAAQTLAPTAYAYVPESCAEGLTCELHISFHGCNQNAQSVGTNYAMQTGLNNWADTNHLVVLYPQTKNSTFMPFNPQGCWDWWGYADPNYANQQGQQISAVAQLAKSLQHYALD